MKNAITLTQNTGATSTAMARLTGRRWRLLALVSCLLLAVVSSAHASGSENAVDEFVKRSSTDISLDRYEKGDLGVLLPSYPRVYLYPAWRAIVLGTDELGAQPLTPNGLRDAVGSYAGNWISDTHPYIHWQKESNKFTDRSTSGGPPVFRDVLKGESQYLNCPIATFNFARENLQMLAKRQDANLQRLRDWVTAQESVFDFCDYDPQNKRPSLQIGRKAPQIPKALSAIEPRYWRQLRQYQIASAHFYNESYVESRQQFELIGVTPDHPMQIWGAYLALRSEIRRMTISTSPAWDAPLLTSDKTDSQENQIKELELRAKRILSNPSLQPLHEATRASIRTAQYRLTPLRRLYELSEQLNITKQNPHQQNALGDWRRLANDLFEGSGSHRKNQVDSDLRLRFSYFDWMRSLQDCGLSFDDQTSCASAKENVLKRWQSGLQDKSSQKGEQRAWMLAALMLSEKLDKQLEAAAVNVKSDVPEYLTVQYHLVRLYRSEGQTVKVREMSEAILKSAELSKLKSDSAIFLFQQERFASASSLDDASTFLVRRSKWAIDSDTGETSPAKDDVVPRLASDGLGWLNTKLSISDLLTIANKQNLPSITRSAIVVAAWMRAELLGQTNLANQAATMALTFPVLKEDATAYLKASKIGDKRHILLMASLKLGMSPVIRGDQVDYSKSTKNTWQKEDVNTVANMWCTIGKPKDEKEDPWARGVEKTPPLPDLSANSKARDQELLQLAKVRTATGFLGDHVIRRVKTHPTDPDLPWLLYVVVQSTRGGCVDSDNTKVSRSAYILLHSKFKNSTWAAKTPAWY